MNEVNIYYYFLLTSVQMLIVNILIINLRLQKLKQGPMDSFLARKRPSSGSSQDCVDLEEKSIDILDICSPLQVDLSTIQSRLDKLVRKKQAHFSH